MILMYVLNRIGKGVIMSIWFFLNAIVFFYAMVKIFTSSFGLHIIFGGIGITLILYNWTRHAVFSTIRANISRKRKIKYAKLSKKFLPIHKYTGTGALIILIIHAAYVLYYFGWQSMNQKMLSGLLAIIVLTAMVIVGWMRFIRTTYNRRMVHLILGYCLFTAVLLHIIL